MATKPKQHEDRDGKTHKRHACGRIRGRMAMDLAILFLLAASALRGQTVLEENFDTPNGSLCEINPRGGLIADGVLTLGKAEGKCWDSATFPIPLDAPFTVSFTLKVTGAPEVDRHAGIILRGLDERDYCFNTRNGDGLGMYITENSQIVRKAAFPNEPKLENHSKVQPVAYELHVEKGFIEAKVNGQALGAVPVNILSVSAIRFYAYNMQVQIDNVDVMKREEKETNDAQQPVFVIDFENGLNAIAENKPVLEPEGQPTTPFANGVTGQALDLSAPKAEDIIYPVESILGSVGAVMFWSSPNGRAFDTLQLQTADGNIRLSCRAMSYAFAVQVTKPDGEKVEFVNPDGKYLFHRLDWNHYAVTWDRIGAIRVFRNGHPYMPSNDWRPLMGYSSGLDFSDVRRIVLLKSAGSRIDDVKIYRRPVSPQEVYAEFRRCSPLDIVIPSAVVQPMDDAVLTVRCAPGGTYARPAQGDRPLTGTQGELTLSLYENADETNAAPLHTLTTSLTVTNNPVDIAFPVGRLAVGAYRLQWSLGTTNGALSQRTIPVQCYDFFTNAAPAKTEDIRYGDLLFEKTFTNADDPDLLKEGTVKAVDGRYLEMENQKGSRIAIMVSGLESFIQKPVFVEIDWPDDKPRMMGFYGYLENKTGESYRDRIQGGIQAGRELPNTGRIITTRYLFYPRNPTFLFEARTLANGFPAAIAALRVYAIEGNTLPRLAIQYPENLEHRRLGNADEDQTLCTSMAYKTVPELTERILDYLDYTGQDTFHYAITRYYFSFFPFPGSNGNGMYPEFPGSVDYIVDAFGKRGKAFVGILNQYTLPEIYYSKVLGIEPAELVKQGLVSLDKYNYKLRTFDGIALKPNLANPKVRSMIVRYLTDFESALKKPAFEAISIWQTLGWGTLDEGYDTYTVTRFSADTGIAVPDDTRYEFLTSEAILPEWQAWRAQQVFLLVKAMREALDTINPKVKIYVQKRNETDWDADLDAKLKTLKNVYACDLRRPTKYRHNFHWGSPEDDGEERLYDVAARRELIQRKSNEVVTLFYTYYETFEKPLDRQNFGCYFQSADVKAADRLFLKELAFNVAASDILEIAMGGQPFGSFGRDAETREFARAFAALPRQSFKTVDASNDNIVVRYLPTKNGTYFYVVSLLWTDAEVQLKLSSKIQYRDLSTGETADDGRIVLKPFQLRSFLIPNETASVLGFTTTLPAELRLHYEKRVVELQQALDLAEKSGLHLPEEADRIRKIRQLLDKEDYVEAHRLAWSLLMNSMLLHVENIDLALRQDQMIRAGKIAINCGSDKFYPTPDGRLFFPDQKFTDKGVYGYYGNVAKSVTRRIDGLKNTNEPGLFQMEAYDMDGYKFQLPNGKYHLRLFLKIGYPDDFKAGLVSVSAFAQEIPLFTDLDLHQAGKGEFMQPIILDYSDIVVTNGLLDVRFEVEPGHPTNHRLCNGIEIIPEK